MSDNFSLIIKNGNSYIQGKFQKIDLGLSGNKILKIGKLDNSNTKSIDAEGKIVLPGVIDTQVHFREPGANNAENLESGSRAAVAGGVTSVFEMPNTNPPTSTFDEFNKKLEAAKNRMFCNYAFYFGATPNNMKELAGVDSLKAVVELNCLQDLQLEIF